MKLRKESNKSKRSRQGVGAIMGGVILVSILVTTVLLYYVSILDNDQRKASYEIQSAQINNDKASENLVATIETELEPCPTSPSEDCIRSDLRNAGSLPLVVSHSAIYCTDCSPATDKLEKRAATLNAQDTATIYLQVDSDNTYKIDFITERGNLANAGVCVVSLALDQCTNDPSGGNPDFIVTSSPSTVFIRPGNSEPAEIIVTSLNGFAGTVSLAVTSPTAEISVSPDPFPPVAVAPGASIATTITVDTDSSVSEGNHLLTFTGTSGSLIRQTTINVVVFNTSDPEEPKEDDSILKPQISGIFPNPFGATNNVNTGQALWGVVVANPSDAPMNVTRVLITAYSPIGGSDSLIPVQTGSSCVPGNGLTMLQPASGWACPSLNTLEWASNSPVTISPHSAGYFVVTLSKSQGGNIASYAINFNVFTNFGQYAKAGYAGSQQAHNANGPVANVYLSTTPQTTPAGSGIVGTRAVQSGADITLHATIANMGPANAASINNDSTIVISIPKAFTNVRNVTPAAGLGSCTNQLFTDGSSQVTCKLTSPLGFQQARTVSFMMTAPTVTTAKLYPLLVLADGTTNNGWRLGPVAENVIVVTP